MSKRERNAYDSETYTFWSNQIKDAYKWREEFTKRGRKINKIYSASNDDLDYTKSNYNILYSNTETILPVIYNDKPRPDVRARNTSNIPARKGAELVEDTISYFIDTADFNNYGRAVTQDFLLAGLGQMRVKYKPYMEEISEKVEGELEGFEDSIFETEDGKMLMLDKVVHEELEYEYINWENFIYPECSCWEDVPWVAFRSFLTYDQVEEMWGAEKADQLDYKVYNTDGEEKKNSTAQVDAIKKACVYEIWDKANREQVFFSDNKLYAIIEINEDPLELTDFFPVPKPLLSITTTDSLLPIPFYAQYQDQAQELNEVCARIASLVENMKRRGFYDKGLQELGNISDLNDNEFFPMGNWGEFLQKGGMQGAMQFEDISSYANVLLILVQRKQEILQDIYSIIGISDIRRAQTDAAETLGAQKLKSRYGTIRISTYQRMVQEFFRDIIKISGEIIATQFQPETIHAITGKPLKTEFEGEGEERKVKEVGILDLLTELRDREPSEIVIDIQSDSTILEDVDEDKADLLDMTGALAQFTQIAPALVSIVGKDATAGMLLTYVEKFKLGRNIHQQVLDHIEELGKAEQQPEPPSDAEILMAKAQLDAQTEIQKAMIQAQVKSAELQIKQQELMLRAQELGLKGQVEFEKLDIEALNTAIKAAGLKAEQANPDDNAIVGS